MKKWVVLPCIVLLAAMAAAQASAPVPAGTALMVKLETTLATFSNKAGDPFQAQLTQPVMLDGKTVIPAGTMVEGRVTKVGEPRRISGKPTIGILPEALILPTGERLFLDATLVDTNIGQGTDVNQEGEFKGSGHDRRDRSANNGGLAHVRRHWCRRRCDRGRNEVNRCDTSIRSAGVRDFNDAVGVVRHRRPTRTCSYFASDDLEVGRRQRALRAHRHGYRG